MIKRLILPLASLIAFILLSSAAQATTMYVTDDWRFEMRETPCWECRISRSLKTGTEVEILQTEEPVEGWKQIRTVSGYQGWMANRYLSDSPSAASQLEAARQISTVAATEQTLLREQFALLTTELQDAGIDVEMVEVSSEDGSVTIQAPRVIGDLSTVGHQNEELLRRNQLLQNELDLRAAEIDRLSDDSWKAHFIYGSSAVFAGVILCLVLGSIKPRKKYSEWA